jgi:hypothetical protein
MENPPPLPDSKAPLGRTFFILLFAPVASMALAAVCPWLGGRNSGLEGFGVVLSLASLLAMLVCSILCAVTVGKRNGAGLAVLTFLGIQVLYIAVACGGCAAVVGKMDFR